MPLANDTQFKGRHLTNVKKILLKYLDDLFTYQPSYDYTHGNPHYVSRRFPDEITTRYIFSGNYEVTKYYFSEYDVDYFYFREEQLDETCQKLLDFEITVDNLESEIVVSFFVSGEKPEVYSWNLRISIYDFCESIEKYLKELRNKKAKPSA